MLLRSDAVQWWPAWVVRLPAGTGPRFFRCSTYCAAVAENLNSAIQVLQL